jgi:hypothetical protein
MDRIANESFESVATFKYFEATLTNQNNIHDEINGRMNSWNACYIQSKIFRLPVSHKKPKD